MMQIVEHLRRALELKAHIERGEMWSITLESESWEEVHNF